MGNKKELRKITKEEKVILQTRGEALFTMGLVVIGLAIGLIIIEIAKENAYGVFGYLTIIMGYIAGFAIYSYKYQKTRGYLILGIVGVIFALGCFALALIL